MDKTYKKIGQNIKKLRQEAKLSQTEVASGLGISRQAVGQIESGDRDMSADELMRASKFFSVSADIIFNGDSKQNQMPKNSFSETVKINFDGKKFRNVLLYLLSKCGGKPNVGETVLYKLLYFIDFDSFELYGKPIIGLKYLHMQFGPVPIISQYGPMIDSMKKNGELKILNHLYGGLAQKKYVALSDSDISIFSTEDLHLVDSVIDRFADMSATKITEYVHEDVPWKATPSGECINYLLVFERTAPFARTDKEMAWQEASGTDSLKYLGKISKEEVDYYEKL